VLTYNYLRRINKLIVFSIKKEEVSFVRRIETSKMFITLNE